MPPPTTDLVVCLYLLAGLRLKREPQLHVERIFMEMVWRKLYHFNQACNRGLATNPVVYLTAPENRDLYIVKVIRKPLKNLDFSLYWGILLNTS